MSFILNTIKLDALVKLDAFVKLDALVDVGNWLLLWFVIPSNVHNPEHNVTCGYVAVVGNVHVAPLGNVYPNVVASDDVGI